MKSRHHRLEGQRRRPPERRAVGQQYWDREAWQAHVDEPPSDWDGGPVWADIPDLADLSPAQVDAFWQQVSAARTR